MSHVILPEDARALIDGRAFPLAEARLAITDDGAARGDGAFETVGVWDGRPFRLPDHLARLRRSLLAVGLPAPDQEPLEQEALALCEAAAGADAVLRLYVTASGRRLLTLAPPPDRPPLRSLVPQPAPWVRPLGTYGPAGAKTMSYAPNMAASRAAVREGADDALLIASEGHVLEGPTFGVLWVAEGEVRAPSVELGIVDSVSRRTVLALAGKAGLDVEEGRYGLDEVLAADELLVCSSARSLMAVERLGGHTYPAETPVRDQLDVVLSEARRSR